MTRQRTTRVLIVDDHELVRAGLSRVLEDTPGIEVVGEVDSAEALLSRSFSRDFDVVLLDLQMPGIGGLGALQQLRAVAPETRCLVLSMHAEETFAVRALREGALGYISKSANPDELTRALRAVADGQRYITPAVATALASYVFDERSSSHESLSQREFEVFLRLARGESTGDIAAELAISVKTVSTYRARVLQKLGARSNADLVRHALEHSLLD